MAGVSLTGGWAPGWAPGRQVCGQQAHRQLWPHLWPPAWTAASVRRCKCCLHTTQAMQRWHASQHFVRPGGWRTSSYTTRIRFAPRLSFTTFFTTAVKKLPLNPSSVGSPTTYSRRGGQAQLSLRALLGAHQRLDPLPVALASTFLPTAYVSLAMLPPLCATWP